MNKNILGIIFLVIGVIIVFGIGYIVLQTEVENIREACAALLRNGTIKNITECNITVNAM